MSWIITWTWQGLAVALAAAGVLRLVRRLDAASRVWLWWTALLAVGALGLLAWLSTDAAPAGLTTSGSGGDAAPVPVRLWRPYVIPSPPPWVNWAILGTWCATVTFSAARLLRAFARLAGIKRGAVPLDEVREARLGRWVALRNRGRKAELVVSPHVATASLLGLGRPVIVLSPATLDALDDDLDLLVVHELGHLRRRDDWLRLAEALIGCLIGLHPAAWWLKRKLCLEREMACDEWVTRATGAVRRYAACLLKLASAPASRRQPLLSPAAVTSRGELTARVERLVWRAGHPAGRIGRWQAAAVAVVLATGAIALGSLDPLLAEAPASPRAEATRKPVVAPGPAVRQTASRAVSPEQLADGRTAGRPARVADAPRTPLRRVEGSRPSPARLRAETQDRPVSATMSTPADAALVVEAAGQLLPSGRREWPDTEAMLSAPAAPPPADDARPGGERSRWQGVTETGVRIGAGARSAATATSGFFTRFAKSVARSF